MPLLKRSVLMLDGIIVIVTLLVFLILAGFTIGCDRL